MNSLPPPVLLTSCVYVADHSVKLLDPTDRIKHTVESIEKWLHYAPTAKLVICDSSGFDFSPIVKSKFPHVAIECLHFEADKARVQYHGKGFGEGEIVRFALENSSYIKQADFFAKCTAKLWVENFNQCLSEWNGHFLCKPVFLNVFSFRKTVLDHVDTRFYLVSKKFYRENLMLQHLDLGGHTGLGIEDKFRNLVLSNNLHGVMFSSPPIIGGVGGGTGKYYNRKWSKRIKEKLRFALVKSDSKFLPFFSRT